MTISSAYTNNRERIFGKSLVYIIRDSYKTLFMLSFPLIVTWKLLSLNMSIVSNRIFLLGIMSLNVAATL